MWGRYVPLFCVFTETKLFKDEDHFTPRPYYQVYRQKHGFLPNLSILDLLMNMGPESIFYL